MTYKIEQSSELINSCGGLAIVGKIIEKLKFQTAIKNSFNGTKSFKESVSNVLTSWIGLLAQGRSSFCEIALYKDDPFFLQVFNLKSIYSEERLRQITDNISNPETIEMLKDLNIKFLLNKTFGTIKLETFGTEYIPVDFDVSPFDNSRTKKENVGRTYKGCDGYAPMFAYIGTEGYILNQELRPGKQHCQKGTPEFIKETIKQLERLGILDKVLFRFDSGNDAAKNIRILNEKNVKYIIKRNLRKESKEQWENLAKSIGDFEKPREGKIVYTGTVDHVKPAGFSDEDGFVEVVFKVTERSIIKDQPLLINQIEVETYWTNTGETPENGIYLYHNHGTSEQFHSELKSDLNVERLASGKFATNNLILTLATIAFNILREIGMKMIEFKELAPVTINEGRKRIKTVLRDIIYVACKKVFHKNYHFLKFGKVCKWFNIFKEIYFSCC
jgi:hypothetical protein